MFRDNDHFEQQIKKMNAIADVATRALQKMNGEQYSYLGYADGDEFVDGNNQTRTMGAALRAEIQEDIAENDALLEILQDSSQEGNRLSPSYRTPSDLFNDATSIVTVTDYGTTGDGLTDDTDAIQAALDACGATGGTVLFPKGTYRIATDLTLDEDVIFLKGSRLSIDAGVTVTISGMWDTINYVFGGLGTVQFSAGAIAFVRPEWWGAVGDNSTECSDAINAALQAADLVGRVELINGIYVCSTPIDRWPLHTSTELRSSIVFAGQSRSDTIIKFTGSTGWLFDLWDSESPYSNKGVHGSTISDLHIMCPNMTDIDSGGGIRVYGSHNTVERVNFTYCTTATCMAYIGTDIGVSESGKTHDTDRVLTGSAGASAYRAIKFTTNSLAYWVRYATITLRRDGTPGGNINFQIWDDDGGSPSAPDAEVTTGYDSEPLSCDSISTDAAGAAYQLGFERYSEPTDVRANTLVSASTDYWLVIIPDADYTYSAGVDQISVRVDAGGGSDSMAAYDGTGASWTTNDDEANYSVVIWGIAGFENKVFDCIERGFTGDVGRFIWGESCIIDVAYCYPDAEQVMYLRNGTVTFHGCYFIGGDTEDPFDLMGNVSFNQCWYECIGTSYWRGYYNYQYSNMIWGGSDIEVDLWTQIDGHGKQPNFINYNPQIAASSNRWKHRLLSSQGGRWNSGGGGTLVADSDAQDGYAIELSSQNSSVQLNFRSIADPETYFSERIQAGTYRLTWYIKSADGDVNNDLDLIVYDDRGTPTIEDTIDYTTTTSYRPYVCYLRVDQSRIEDSSYWVAVIAQKKSLDADNLMYLSHLEVEYLGADRVYQRDIHLVNMDSGDADGDRESRLLFSGFQSGNEQHALAMFIASHLGSGDDQFASLKLKVNRDGEDFDLSDILEMDGNGEITSYGTIVENGAVGTMTGDETFTRSDGNLFIKDPGGSARNFDPSGTFSAMTMVTVINTADNAETITFDNGGLGQAIAQNESGIFAYDGSNWLTIFVG